MASAMALRSFCAKPCGSFNARGAVRIGEIGDVDPVRCGVAAGNRLGQRGFDGRAPPRRRGPSTKILKPGARISSPNSSAFSARSWPTRLSAGVKSAVVLKPSDFEINDCAQLARR